RIDALAPRSTRMVFLQPGECAELVGAKAQRLHPRSRIIVLNTGVARPGGLMPDPELCTRESLVQAIPEAKRVLAALGANGASDSLRATAAHWDALMQKFNIEDTP